MQKSITTISCLLLIVMLACITTVDKTALAQEEKDQEEQAISMDFDQVDIRVFIKFISELIGKNFVVDDRVKGKVTVISPSAISIAEAYKVFESVLEVNGFATVPSGEVTKIVSAVEARRKSVETNTEVQDAIHLDDSIVTQVVRLENADVNQIKKVIIPMVSKTGLVVDYAPTQSLIITDNSSNLQRLMRIIRNLDVPAEGSEISVMELENANALELVQNIQKIFVTLQKQETQKGTASPLVIIPEKRLNLLIVLASKELTGRIKKLVAKLDTPTPKEMGNIRVVKLNNAVAEDLAKVLSGLAGAKVGDDKQEKESIISKEARIVADKATNSLVITSSPDEYALLQDIINQLDQRRKQVFIEAAILEVSSDSSFDFGVDWFSGGTLGNDDNIIFGKLNSPNLGEKSLDAEGLNPIDVISNTMGSSDNFSFGLLSFPFSFDGKTFYSLGQFVHASKSKDQVNIISTPQIMTLENEEASVVVAENRPFVTSQDTTDADRDYTNFSYKDVGVTLKVTPQINDQGSVKLDLYQEVSRVDKAQTENFTTPVTKKRTAETRVEVSDGQTLAIAGLMEEEDSKNLSGVPYLMDIPILGGLFKQRDNKSSSKKNLMIFITPHVVRTVKEADQLYFDKAKHIQNLRYDLEGKARAFAKDFLPSAPMGLN